MKKFGIIAFLLLLVAGCSEKTYEPRDIVPETDVCKICNMSIVHEDYAGQIVLDNGDYEIFDDIGCLMEYIDANGDEEIGAAFIKDFNNEWINVFTGSYVYSKDIWTPMNYGVIAFDSEKAAQDWIASEGQGELLVYNDLLDFKWGLHH